MDNSLFRGRLIKVRIDETSYQYVSISRSTIPRSPQNAQIFPGSIGDGGVVADTEEDTEEASGEDSVVIAPIEEGVAGEATPLPPSVFF